MKLLGKTDDYLYTKKGFNIVNINSGTAMNMDEVYNFSKRTGKKPGELSKEEYMTFRNRDNDD